MRLALLKGNRFNPWHLQAYTMLPDTEVTAFRAESEIQDRFKVRDDGSLNFRFERIHFDTEAGPPWRQIPSVIGSRYFNRPPRILPFYERLRGFDAIHSWELFTDWTSEALAARAAFDVPVSLMIWDNLPFHMEDSAYHREIKARAIEQADRFIVHTERSRRVLDMEGVPEERIVQMNPGVDTQLFAPGDGDREKLGVSDDEFVILFVGWLLPRKGIDFLIQALHELVSDTALSNIKFRLLIVGSGPGKDRVDALLARTGLTDRCTFAGSLSYDEMPAVYRTADLFVLPSIATPDWQEQFGMSIIEAMASGVPVVTTYSGAIPEVVGDAAVLCQPNDFLSLFEAIKSLALEPSRRDELGRAGRERAVNRFGMTSFVDGLKGVFSSLVAGS